MSNRVIKFRAWNKELNKWIGNGKALYLTLGEDINNNNRFELMQYTGVNDKSGREIYEGDIIKIKGDLFTRQDYYLGVVEYGCHFISAGDGEYGNNALGFYITNNIPPQTFVGDDEDLNFFEEDKEVVGNIYENPELLK